VFLHNSEIWPVYSYLLRFQEKDHIVKFQPPDACYIEVLRFRTRPPKARELPMQARCIFTMVGNKVEIKADIMVPYHATKAWGQVSLVRYPGY